MFTLEHFKGNKIYLAKERKKKKTKKKKKAKSKSICLNLSFVLKTNKWVWLFFFFRLPRCKPPVPRKPSISPKPANLSRSPSAPSNQGDSMQRKQNLSVGNANCNLAWNKSSQETYFLYFWIYMIDIFVSMIKNIMNKITVVRLFLFWRGVVVGCYIC